MSAIKNLFGQAQVLLIHTGAGMGRDSGLADYRGEGGTWGEVSEQTGANVLDVINPAYLAAHPAFAWQHFAERRQAFLSHPPHEGYYLIKKWIEKFELDYFAVTSNIDGHFQQAGYDENRIREVHGSIHFLQCSRPCNDMITENTTDPASTRDTFPLCPSCGTPLRPNVYMFRDDTFVKTRFEAQKSRWLQFLEQHRGKKMIVLEIGSGPHVQTIRAKSREMMTDFQATLIRINPKDFRVREGHFAFAKGALEALREMEGRLS